MSPNAPHAADNPALLVDDLQQEVDAAADYGLFPPIEVEVLAVAPITILVSLRGSGKSDDVSSALGFISSKLFPKDGDTRKFLFRGVKLTRLAQVMSFGCDVSPSTAPLYASEYASKALEYGDLVMVFDPARLDKTFRKVPKSECPETLSRLREEYPTAIEDDENWWFSKLPPGNGRTGTIYESYYTFFIPGDPHEALLMLFLAGNDRNALRDEFLRCTGKTQML